MDYEKIAKRLHLRFKFDILRKYYGEKEEIVVLDVGTGSHSASIFKKYYPQSHYVGIDKTNEYAQDFSYMERFIILDLSQDNIMQKLDGEKFDLIIMSHVLEHLVNGDKVICDLFEHLKEHGKIYIEWPGEKAVLLPKGKHPTLNFYDDSTHIKIYPLYQICNLLCTRGGIL